MSANWYQIYQAHPTTTFQANDVFYLLRSPYDNTGNFGFTYSTLSSQFASSNLNNAHIYVGNAGNIATSVSLSGDGTLSNTGAITVTKTNGVLFAPSATTDTTNAANITSGILNSARISGSYTGITGIGTLTAGTWNASVIGETFGGTGQIIYTLGDILYSSASNTLSKLAGNTTTTKQYLSQTGTGVISAAPTWATITGSDITGSSLFLSNDPNLTLSATVNSSACLLRPITLTIAWTGILPYSRGGTGTNTSFTSGSIIFAGASNHFDQDNTNLFWDNTNKLFGIRINTPSAQVDSHFTSTASVLTNFNSIANNAVDSSTSFSSYTSKITSTVARTTGLTFGYYNVFTYNAGDGGGHEYIDFVADDAPNNSGSSPKVSFYAGANKTYCFFSASGAMAFIGYTPQIYSDNNLNFAFDGSAVHGTATFGLDNASGTFKALVTVNGTIGLADAATQTYGNGLSSEVSGSLVNFGINDARFSGTQSNTDQGGFLRFDSRSNTPLAQFWWRTGGSGSLNSGFYITPKGSTALVGGSASPTATDGFPYMPKLGGTPTSTPTALGGLVPFAYDDAGDVFYVYNGAWKGTALVSSGTFTVTATGFTVVGVATYTGTYVRIGKLFKGLITAVSTGTISGMTTVSYFTGMPVDAVTNDVVYVSSSGQQNLGTSLVNIGPTSKIWSPTFVATSNIVVFSFNYITA